MKILLLLMIGYLTGLMANTTSSVLEDTDYAMITYAKGKTITLPELIYIYKGKLTRWQNGDRIVLFVVKLSDREQLRFATDVLGISRNSFKAYLRSNKAATVINKRLLIRKVASTNGGLAMVSRTKCLLNVNNVIYEVKVVEE